MCFQREPRTPVPGCIGGDEETSKTDFCVPDPSFTGMGTAEGPTRAPVVAGDKQLATDTPESVPVPATFTSAPINPVTKTPAAAPIAAAAVTAKPTTAAPVKADPTPGPTPPLLELNMIGNDGSPSSLYPLGLCQGDCDNDAECADGLICFQRDQNDPVPGCLGTDSSRNDYCIVDPNAVPSESPSASPMPTNVATTMAPTSSNQPTLRPTVSPSPTIPPSDMPSYVPSDMPSLIPSMSLAPTVSSEPTGVPSGAPTIEPLEGIRLKLYWEEGYLWQDETIERKCKYTYYHGIETVNDCYVDDWNGSPLLRLSFLTFCIPKLLLQPSPLEPTNQRIGCMISDYRGFPGTGKCWHGLRTEDCHQDMVYVARCDSDKRQEFSILPMKGGTQYLISLHAENKCLERYEYSLILRECDEMNPLQRFWLPRGSTYSKRFELSPITLANHCVTQSHHPKSVSYLLPLPAVLCLICPVFLFGFRQVVLLGRSLFLLVTLSLIQGEVVQLQRCSTARHIEHQSSFWNIY